MAPDNHSQIIISYGGKKTDKNEESKVISKAGNQQSSSGVTKRPRTGTTGQKPALQSEPGNPQKPGGGNSAGFKGTGKVSGSQTGSQLTKRNIEEFNRANPSSSQQGIINGTGECDEILSEDGQSAVADLLQILIKTFKQHQ